MNCKKLIKKLALKPHPEGGYFKETYRSGNMFNTSWGKRNSSTAIYYMLIGNDFSCFHRIKSDELWHHYYGCGIIIHEIKKDGKYEKHKLGIEKGFVPQIIIEAKAWFAAELNNKKSFSLAGCTVSPGFDFRDFEISEKENLLSAYPEYKKIIKRFTRELPCS
ncbi:MAG: hypothetical protein ACD_79C01052G0002 [uncultured bacterium]|nr:MAG: hypothetical protein ACD_79C01052G0002 [uncultured bacterium]